MNVRMVNERLSPGVQHAEKADLRAQPLGIGRDFQQRRGGAAEQQVVQQPLVLQHQCGKLMRDREHDVKVADAGPVRACASPPSGRAPPSDTWAVAVAAGVEGKAEVFAAIYAGSRCRPSAAVRQRSMARMALCCGQATRVRLRSRKRAAYARKMSATSKMGRLMTRPAPHRPRGESSPVLDRSVVGPQLIEQLPAEGDLARLVTFAVRDPVLSPIHADLKGFPPTLCMTSTRDHCLSGTADFHRALLRAGVDARLMVFDAMPHAFWYRYDLPESKEALEAQASFLDQHLG